MTSGGGTGGRADVLYIDVEGRFEQFDRRLAEVEQSAGAAGERTGSKFGNALSIGMNVAMGAALALSGVLVAAAGSAVNLASEQTTAVAALEARLGATTAEAQHLGDVAAEVFGDNWGGSLTEVTEAVGTVRQQLGDLADDELKRVAEGALAIKDSFGIEVPESVSAAKTLMEQFGLTSQQATDFLAAGFQKGLDRSGDFLDTINEYSTQFANGGASAEQFFSLLESGMQGGALGTDKAADAFKEFRVRIQDGSEGVATALESIGINSEDLARKMASGQVTTAQAFTLVQSKLAGLKDENLRMQAGVALIGTQYEDLGQKGAAALSLTGRSMADLSGSTDKLNAKYNNLGDFMTGLGRKLQVALLPLGQEMLKLANEAAPYLEKAVSWLGDRLPGWIKTGTDAVKTFAGNAVQAYNTLNSAYSQVLDKVERFTGFLKRNQEILIPLAAGIGTVAGALAIHRAATIAATAVTTAWTAVTTAATAASVALRVAIAFITGPVGLAVAAITALVAAGVYLYRNWDEVKAKALAIWGSLKAIVAGAINSVVSYLRGIDLKEVGLDIVRGLANGILAGPRLILQAAQGLGKAVISGVKGILNIQSPSKEMYILGEHTVQGYANGITKTTPTVQKAAADMGRSVISEADKARAALEKDIRMDAWVTGLRSATDAQLAHALETARAAGEVEKYNALKSEQQRRTDAATAASDRAADAARREAEQLVQNRQAIADTKAEEAWRASLGGLTDAQIAQGIAAAEAAGNQSRWSDLTAEQKRRADEAAQAVSDLADEEIRLANARYQNTQAATDSAYRQSYGAGDEGLIRSLAAVTGFTVQQVRDDVEAALADAKRWNADAAAIIERVWADALAHRREVAAAERQEAEDTARAEQQAYAETRKFVLDTLSNRTDEGLLRLYDEAHAQRDTELMEAVAAEIGRRAEALNARILASDVETSTARTNAIAEGYRAEQEAADDTAITVASLTGQIDELLALGRDPRQPGFTDWLDELAKGSGRAAEAATYVKKNLDAILSTRAFLAARPGDDATVPLGAPEAPRPARTAPTAEMWEWAQQGAPDRQVQAFTDSLKLMTLEELEAARAAAVASRNSEQYLAVMAQIRARTDEAARAHADWNSNLQQLGHAEWVKGLRDLSDAEVEAGLEAARASENVDEFNVYLAEHQRRTDEASKNTETLTAARQKLTETLQGGAAPYAAEIAALEALRGKPGVVAAELDELINTYKQLQAEAQRRDQLENTINSWANYARQLIPVVTGAMEALGGTTSEVAQQWGQDLGSMVNDLVSFGTAIARGDYLGAAIQALTSIFNWFTRNKRAAQEAAKATREYNEQFRFAAGTAGDNYGTRTVDKYTTGFLFWSTDHYTEQIDQLKRDIALALEGGFANGIKDGFTQALAQNDFSLFEKSLKSSVGKAVLDGLIESFINQAVLARIIGPAIDAYLQNGDAAALQAAIRGASGEAQQFYDQVLKPIAQEFGLLGTGTGGATTDNLTQTVTVEVSTVTASLNFDVLGTLASVIDRAAPRIEAGGRAVLDGGGLILAAADRMERILTRADKDWGALR